MVIFEWSGVAVGLVLLTIAAQTYVVMAMTRVARFREGDGTISADLPAVSVMKPLCGAEPRLYECLRSFCDQSYPDFEIVFGVAAHDDPAVAVVERLRREFPGVDMRLAVDARVHGANLKVSNLINMMPLCRHEVLVIADSDVLVEPDALRKIVEDGSEAKVGAVSSLYKGVATAGFASRLGALFINDWFLPSVLVDVSLNGVDGCFGAMMMVKRQALDDIGGFATLSDHLAEDNLLGRLVRQHGWKLRLARQSVITMVSETDLLGLARHELRWARTVKACRLKDQVLSVITHPLWLLGGLLFLAPTALGVGLVCLYTASRVVLHVLVGWRFGLPWLGTLWLVPLREGFSLAIWSASLMGSGVHWRGRDYSITADGRMVPALPMLSSLSGSALPVPDSLTSPATE